MPDKTPSSSPADCTKPVNGVSPVISTLNLLLQMLNKIWFSPSFSASKELREIAWSLEDIIRPHIKVDTRLLLEGGTKVVVIEGWHHRYDQNTRWIVGSVLERPFHSERNILLSDILEIIE